MSKNSRELPDERLASLDAQGHRTFIFPAKTQGFFHSIRQWFHPLLIFLYLALPWININGQQIILLNIPERKFIIFGLTFWAHDAPIMFFVIALSLFGLSFLTALWGRVWCGWACPQTVFIETIYRRIEQWIEGNHIQQRKLYEAPMSANKFFKKTLKWSLFLIVSLVLTHSFLAYFVGTSHVLEMMQHSPTENLTSFIIVMFTTAVILLDFGWLREQFCIIMCPYGRFQSVLLDEHSINIMYDENRGEPRKAEGVSKDEQGDCINCYKCVAVCPTGVDIRRGVQMECIACTACIDICDDVMEKINKPKGLIRYASEKSVKGEKTKIIRPRIVLYLGFIFLTIAGLAQAVMHREPLHINVIRAIQTPYTMVQDQNGQEKILNQFKIHIKNLTHDVKVSYKIDDEQAPYLELIAPLNPVMVKSGEFQRPPVFVRFSYENFKNHLNTKIHFVFTYDLDGQERSTTRSVKLLGPEK